jgi:DNA-binding response OmpR family regulator
MDSRKRLVLIADNDPNIVNVRAEYLQNEGYIVFKATSLEEIKEILSEKYIHLAILDIRMIDDDDEKDISGLTLAKDPAYRTLPKIILTGFPSILAVREALGPTLEGLPPAVNFIYKTEGHDVLIKAIDSAFDQFVQINWDIEIQWDKHNPISFWHLVSMIEPSLSSEIIVNRVNELEDLVRKLYHDYKQIRVGQILWHDSQLLCLPILAYSQSGALDSQILICGERKSVELDRKWMKELAPENAQGTKFHNMEETLHYGANLYWLPNADVETIQTFQELIKVGKEKPLKAALTHLLNSTLRPWHDHGQKIEEKIDLLSVYRQYNGLVEDNVLPERREEQIKFLIQSLSTLKTVEIKYIDEQIIFHFTRQPPRYFPNPLAVVYSPFNSFNETVIRKISPGRITANNVLVDVNLRTWLTDFRLAGQAPQWWDFICLEAAFRFDLGQAPDLLAWQEFEQCLVKPARLDEKLDQGDVIPEMRTVIALIEQVRQQAAIETGPNPLPYYAGLLAWSVAAFVMYEHGVLYTQSDRIRFAHLLLAASMLAERLGEKFETSLTSGRLRLDEDGRVWIGERNITTLAGLGQKLLACLFEHEGQIVNNRMIVAAYGEEYSEGDSSQDQRIRQEISRLRKDIEPDLNHLRYIITIREKGYRLNADGESNK